MCATTTRHQGFATSFSLEGGLEDGNTWVGLYEEDDKSSSQTTTLRFHNPADDGGLGGLGGLGAAAAAATPAARGSGPGFGPATTGRKLRRQRSNPDDPDPKPHFTYLALRLKRPCKAAVEQVGDETRPPPPPPPPPPPLPLQLPAIIPRRTFTRSFVHSCIPLSNIIKSGASAQGASVVLDLRNPGLW